MKPNLIISIMIKIFRLMAGYALYGLGTVMTLNANKGLAPWNVFHEALSIQLGISIGVVIQVVGAVIMIMDILFKERIGWGTIGNVIFIGFFVDWFMVHHLVPIYEDPLASYTLMAAGMGVIALATYFYLSAQLGAGPRDGLMIALTKRVPLPVGLVRNILEFMVLATGYFLGGSVGLGTLIMAIGIGRLIQITFNIFKFDVRQVRHRYVDEDITLIFNCLKSSKSN